MCAPQLLALLCALLSAVRGEADGVAPRLVHEPAPVVRYAAARGASVACAARGTPAPHVTWVQRDGGALHDPNPHRRAHDNGTLELLPAAGAAGEAVVVRCRAANTYGVALSREVTLQPVVEGEWEAEARAPPAAPGAVAGVECAARGAAAHAARWYRDRDELLLDPPAHDSRYVMAGDVLLIRDVTAADTHAYGCLARHALTDTTRRARPARPALTPLAASGPPRLLWTGGEVQAVAGSDVCLPCAAAGLAPHYTWYREVGGRLQPLEADSSGGWTWAGGAARCLTRVPVAAAGLWVCKVRNTLGEATARVTLHVRDTLHVTVTPDVLVVSAGEAARFTCSASAAGAALEWRHDGTRAGAGPTLELRDVTRAHRGLYQCFASVPGDSAHGDAELRLTEWSPELHYTFTEQARRAGGTVSLRCAASGAPPPRFTWLLDDAPLDVLRAAPRVTLSVQAAPSGDVFTALNVSALVPADGGRYTCRAHNTRGHVQHTARLNVYGPPSVRALGAVRAVAGTNATVYCPYAGYPISSVVWLGRDGAPVGGAGRVSARGAALRLTPAMARDAGRYACAVSAPDHPAVRADLELIVRNPPKISPFMFSPELTEGSSAQVLCGVSSGDKPMYFSWLKDDAPLPSNLQIEEKSLNEFSLLMFSELTARHSGAYTCRVTNHAATINYTAQLSVNVAPSWVTEPHDTAVLLGAPLQLACAARGHPPPALGWHRRLGDVGEGAEQWAEVGNAQFGLRAHNGSLSAASASRAHRGIYRCEADNGVGPPILKLVNVSVHEPAHLEGGGGNVSGVRGRSAALACVALGDEPLAVRWTRDGLPLDLASYRWTLSEVRAAGALRSTLHVRVAERSDAGEYRCHARNAHGRAERLLHLHVDEPPEAPRAMSLCGLGARWVRVRWDVPDTAGPRALTYSALYAALHAPPAADAPHNTVNVTIHTTTDHSSERGSHVACAAGALTATLGGLHPAVAYSVRLFASNHVGQSPHSEPLLFTTLDEAPGAAPRDMRARSTAADELHCTWAAPLQDTWNGELLGYVLTWRELNAREDEHVEPTYSWERQGHALAAGWASTELTVSGLRGATRYALTVRALNRAGAGPPSHVVVARTAEGAPEGAPRDVLCRALSPRALHVRWAGPQARVALAGYELHYTAVHFVPPDGGGADASGAASAGPACEATLQGLRAATNYTVWVRARAAAGHGPPSAPVYCHTADDVPEAPALVRALGVARDAVRVTWLAPRPARYTLYARELARVGGEWAQRVDVPPTAAPDADLSGAAEVWREVRGLRERTVYEFWVRAATAAGAGPPSRAVTAAPTAPLSVRVASLSRAVYAVRGARVRLRCAAVGAPPLQWRWAPLPPTATVTAEGDLIIHKLEEAWSGNYTCAVSGRAGADALRVLLGVRAPPAAPAPRLVRATVGALHLAWDTPTDGGASLASYSARWGRADAPGAEHARRVPAGERALVLRGLVCGALYRVSLRAHNALGASPPSSALLARTRGEQARPAPGKAFLWANSTTLRMNLLAWGGRCPVTSWSIAVRPTTGGDWLQVDTNGEFAEAGDLRPNTWYEVRVLARALAGDVTAHYRAATRALSGEPLGEPVEVAVEAQGVAPGGSSTMTLAPALLGGALALLLAALAALATVRRHAGCTRRGTSPRPMHAPHTQLYSTEPSKKNGTIMTSPDVGSDSHDISPYATFSMTSAGGAEAAGDGAAACALHLSTLARAAPPRPDLLAPRTGQYHRRRTECAALHHLTHRADAPTAEFAVHDTDSESSGSPCAACAAPPAAQPSRRSGPPSARWRRSALAPLAAHAPP